MTSYARTGVLGGTFDPIHLGHRDLAIAAQTALGLDRILLIPARTPPHRPCSPVATPLHRLAMVALAAVNEEGLESSDLELRSTGPSFTSSTLAKLAGSIAPIRMFFITGADAFADIASWHDYPGLLDRSHFVVVSRPGYPATALVGQLPLLASRMTCSDGGAVPISDTQRTRIWLVDAHTRDISASNIRERLASGERIDDLVETSVAQYISRHRLYEPPLDAPLHG